MKITIPPFIPFPLTRDEGPLKTVEETVNILNGVVNGYALSDDFILAGIRHGEIDVEPLGNLVTFNDTKYDFLISNSTILCILQEKFQLNEKYARSLIEDN
ncbi:MAG: hypothetical protein RR651_14650 [Lysinibacillus sp.]